MYKVYILFSAKINRYYIGHTENFSVRYAYHNDSIRNRIWTRRGIPWEKKIVFTFESRSEAMELEVHLKDLKSRSVIEKIILYKKVNWKGRTIAPDPD